MRGQRAMMHFGKGRQAEEWSQTSDAGKVWLKDVGGPALKVSAKFVQSEQRFAEGKGNLQSFREPDMSFDIFARERLFEPVDAYLLLEEMAQRKGGSIVIALVGVDAQPDVFAKGFADPGDSVRI